MGGSKGSVTGRCDDQNGSPIQYSAKINAFALFSALRVFGGLQFFNLALKKAAMKFRLLVIIISLKIG